MKPRGSSLNPCASAYVPVSKRKSADISKDLSSHIQTGNEAALHGHIPNNTLSQGPHQNVFQNSFRKASAVQTDEFSKWKDHHGREFYASSSNYLHEKPGKSNFIEDYDTDLAYLQMIFPGISEQSLSDIYSASNYDVEIARDMMEQLEAPGGDPSLQLPDTLDIGDVPEYGPSSDYPYHKLKNNMPGAGPSASGSSK